MIEKPLNKNKDGKVTGVELTITGEIEIFGPNPSFSVKIDYDPNRVPKFKFTIR